MTDRTTAVQRYLADTVAAALYEAYGYDADAEEDANQDPPIQRVEITEPSGDVYFAVILSPDQYHEFVGYDG